MKTGSSMLETVRGSQSKADAASGVMGTLYVSYDGILEPLGQSQIVTCLLGLSPSFSQTLITFEKPHDLKKHELVREMEAKLAMHRVRWVRLRYHKWPPILSTLWDGIRGVMVGLWICSNDHIKIIHARGYVPAMIAKVLKKISGPKFLFDMRGYWADEKKEAYYLAEPPADERRGPLKILFAMEGFWADEKVAGWHWLDGSTIYKITKRCEKMFFESADAIVSLTVAGAEVIPSLGYAVPSTTPIEVIPTCTDLDRFKPAPKDHALLSRLGLEGRLILGCVGTISNWYLRWPMLHYLSYLLERLDNAVILVVTKENHERLRRDTLAADIPADRLVLTQAEFSAMPDYVRLMDAGVFFIKACFGKKGSAATKLGEFLACGVPVIINDGVGDSGWIVKQHRVGVVLDDVTCGDFERSLSAVRALFSDRDVQARCRETAQRYFDMATGVWKYNQLYRNLMVDPKREIHAI